LQTSGEEKFTDYTSRFALEIWIILLMLNMYTMKASRGPRKRKSNEEEMFYKKP
jgi:hypothetical protein